jgi:hypothetical protein
MIAVDNRQPEAHIPFGVAEKKKARTCLASEPEVLSAAELTGVDPASETIVPSARFPVQSPKVL